MYYVKFKKWEALDKFTIEGDIKRELQQPFLFFGQKQNIILELSNIGEKIVCFFLKSTLLKLLYF